MNKKQSTMISSDENLRKELESVVKIIRDRKIKTIIFNHDNTVYNNIGLVAYDAVNRVATMLHCKQHNRYIRLGVDDIMNVGRLRLLQDVANNEDILSHKDIYAIIDDNNNFKCIDAKYNKYLKFDEFSKECPKIYYNSYSHLNNFPKYLVTEYVDQYKLCSDCDKLILTDLEGAKINDAHVCYDCIVKFGKEWYLDSNLLKLMRLHKLESE